MTNLKNQIQEFAQSIETEIIDIRAHLHQNPELSFEEFKTSEYIQAKLDEYGIPYTNGFVKTGPLYPLSTS